MPRPRRLSWRRGCAAAGVLALVSAAAAAAAPPAVVPWLDQRPVRAAASPRPAPLCRAGDLRARLFLQGATGSLVGGVDLLNAGSLPCALVGWPEVALTGAAAAATGWQVKRIARAPTAPDALADPPGSLRALAPGKSATLSLFWSNWCGPGSEPAGSSGTPPDGITLILASRTRLTVPVTQAPRCDAQ